METRPHLKPNPMNYEEYLRLQEELKIEFNKKKLELMKDFVRSNNPHAIGDVVTDHIGSIRIETIGFSWGFESQPCAIYKGLELKKDGTPTKRQSKREVYQSNLIK